MMENAMYRSLIVAAAIVIGAQAATVGGAEARVHHHVMQRLGHGLGHGLHRLGRGLHNLTHPHHRR
jgi:hypothetical protein